MNDIIANLSVHIFRSFSVFHDENWREHRVKSDYVLWSVSQGHLWVTVGDRCFKAGAGDAVLFYPGCEYEAHTDAQGCSFGFVHFRLTVGNEMDLLYNRNLSGVAKNTGDFTKELRRMNEQISFSDYLGFLNFLEKVFRLQQRPDAQLFRPVLQKVYPSRIQQAVDDITKNYRTITVQAVASHVHMNEKAFISAFKKTVALTPGQYIFKCKMRRAAQMLTESDCPVSKVAAELNFSDVYAFSKAFKRYYGMSPTEFKKNTVV